MRGAATARTVDRQPSTTGPVSGGIDAWSLHAHLHRPQGRGAARQRRVRRLARSGWWRRRRHGLRPALLRRTDAEVAEIHLGGRDRPGPVLLLPGLEQRHPRPRSDEIMLAMAVSYFFDAAKEDDWEPLLIILEDVDTTLTQFIRFLIKLQKIWNDFVAVWNKTIGPLVDTASELLDDL